MIAAFFGSIFIITIIVLVAIRLSDIDEKRK